MPVQGDVYVQRTKEDILAFLQAAMKEEYGEDIDFTESSAFSTFAEAISELDAQELEPAIQDVFEAAYLETATGQNLDNLVSILGIQRRAATSATGTITFSSDTRVTQTHAIPENTTIQTDSEDPISFSLIEGGSLLFIDSFEGGSLDPSYEGDTGSFDVVTSLGGTEPNPTDGTYALQSNASGQIIDPDATVKMGYTIQLDMQVHDNGNGSFLFGVQDSSNYYELRADPNINDVVLYRVVGGTRTQLANMGTLPSIGWEEVTIDWQPENGGTLDISYGTASLSVTGEDVYTEGGIGFQSNTGGDWTAWDFASTTAARLDARCDETGPIGNVAPNTLTVATTALSGVDSITNTYEMGNTNRVLTSLDNFTQGLDEETDEELRERATVSVGARGDGTVDAIIAELTAVEGVKSVKLYENDTDTDNTGTGGLPPVSFEAVVYGSYADSDLAEALFGVVGFTSRSYGGAHGTQITDTVDAENGQQFTMEWSEPTVIDIDMTLDLVVDDTYVGDREIRNRIVAYVGGTDADGAPVLGTEPEEDIYINQIEDAIVGPEDTGVIGVDTSGTSYTPTTTTDSNGLEIIDIGSDEVGEVDATDGSITINTTTV